MSEQAVTYDDGPTKYSILHTMRLFHEHPAQYRCIVGPVGSGKTTAATWEICYYKPMFLFKKYGIKRTKWVIVRNSYLELIDTTQTTVFDWFPDGDYRKGIKNYYIKHENGVEVELLFRSCDRPQDVKKFKSLEIQGYWIDESVEVKEDIRLMLKNRIGRLPVKSPTKFGIETTNPPDIEHPTYTMFDWNVPPPGPIVDGEPLEDHAGFWQPPGENNANLREGYYDQLRKDYRNNPDWLEMYIDGKPGVIAKGKLVYANFKRQHHVATEPLIWSKGTLYRGWDNSGNTPAAIVMQIPTAGQAQILREFTTDKLGIVDFTELTVNKCNMDFPGADYVDYADPAGENQFSKKGGGFTSNAQLMRDVGVDTIPSEQNLTARIQSVDRQLGKIDGCLIDPSCIRIINGFLGGYHYPEIGNTGIFSENITKNRFSHPQDGVQYVFVKLFGSMEKVIEVQQPGAGPRIAANHPW